MVPPCFVSGYTGVDLSSDNGATGFASPAKQLLSEFSTCDPEQVSSLGLFSL